MKALKFLESNGYFCTDCFQFFDENNAHYEIKTEFNSKFGTLNPNKIQVKKYCPHCGGTPEIENFSPFAWYHLISKIEYYRSNGITKELPEIIYYYKVYQNINGKYELTNTLVTNNYTDIQKYADAENFIIDIIDVTQQNNTLIFGIDFA